MATIPAIEELKKYKIWVCFTEVPHPTREGKFKKPPVSAITGKRCKINDESNLTTYQKAKAFYIVNKKRLDLKGLGIVFTKDLPYVGLDYDNCVVDGKLTDFAQRQLSTFDSYAEWSYSGNGFHIIAKAPNNFSAKTSNRNGIETEIYSHSRYFVITGQHIEGSPDVINDIWKTLKYRVIEVADENKREVTIDTVRQMLSFIPGDGLDYNTEWLQILMAIHSKFPGADGLEVVREWTGAFCEARELEMKWRSFRKGGTNIGTLIHFAREHGWDWPDDVDTRLERVRPKLTPVQKVQVKETIEHLAEKRAWEIYHEQMLQDKVDIGYDDIIAEHLQLGWRKRTIDEDGVITPEAVTVPYYVEDSVVAIEFRIDYDTYEYDGDVGLYHVKPMFPEQNNYGIILPDSLAAVQTYLSGEGNAAVYGLPHTEIQLELPDMALYCIMSDSTDKELLEILDAYGVRFVKVRSVGKMLENLNRKQIERIATRGKRLSGVI